jgi:FkbM family methyltransferase
MNPTWKDVMKFELRESPVIFDLGGYLGDWTQIAKEYYDNSTIYVFEPVKKNYDIIVNRFINDNSVKVFNFGLSDKNDTVKISLTGDSSSMHISDDSNCEDVEIKDIREFLFENNIFSVDLIKINIEGEEYNLLEYLSSSTELNIFENYLVQFHKFVDDYENRRNKILTNISQYYDRLFNYEMIFEGWTHKKIKNIGCIGDSHISIFSNNERIIDVDKYIKSDFYNSYRVGSWLAFNLNKRIDEIKNISNNMSEDTILFCFGEIDCRAQVKKISEDYNRDFNDVIKEIVDNYFILIDSITDKSIIIHSITPELVEHPHHYYYKDHLEDFDCPRGTYQERKLYKEIFNKLVQEKCDFRGIKFSNIYNMIENSLYKNKLYLDDIHLKPMNVNYLIKRSLIDLKII